MINNYFEFNFPNSLQPLVDKINSCTNYKNILDFFNLKSFRIVKVNLFDKQEDFIAYVKSLNKQNYFIPSYCKGTFDNGMINHSITDLNDKNVMRYSCSVFHELVHIINEELIYDKRVVWFDEGLAQNLSGEKSGLKDTKELLSYIKDHINIENIPPNLNDLQHGNSFVNEKYNGYTLSYVLVRYLIDSMGRKEFLNLAKHSEQQMIYGNKDIFKKVINFYENDNLIAHNL